MTVETPIETPEAKPIKSTPCGDMEMFEDYLPTVDFAWKPLEVFSDQKGNLTRMLKRTAFGGQSQSICSTPVPRFPRLSFLFGQLHGAGFRLANQIRRV